MYLKYQNKQITGILSIVPKNEVTFEDELHNYNFSKNQSLQLKKLMGFNKHRIVKTDAIISDLCVYGFNYLFNNNLVEKNDIDALILLTNTPDYILPPTSNIIQGKLNLKDDIICLDINQGCGGFLVGLAQAFMLLEQPEIKKVAVVNADILSRIVSPKDRSFYPLLGDAAAITIVEEKESSEIYQFMKMDGKGAETIIVPAGGLKTPFSKETLILKEDSAGNVRNEHQIYMDGTAIYNFVMEEVPSMIMDILEKHNLSKDSIDYFMMHQPNKFMLERLGKKLKIPQDKLPTNVVENFGNSGSVTIPNAITYNLGKSLTNDTKKICLAAFGEGLIWSSLIMDIGNLNFCELIDFDI
jgi:3-oxoacyl-[acyl-carrier-protein] synthase III